MSDVSRDAICPTCRGTGRIPNDKAAPVNVTADRIRMLMADREWTQEALAQTLGRTQTAVSYWVTAKRRPGYDDLCALANLFGVSTDYLLGREG